MEENKRYIIDIGESAAEMSYPELTEAALDLRDFRLRPEEAQAVRGVLLHRAKALGMGREFASLLKAVRPDAPPPPLADEWPVVLDARGNPLTTIENIACILEHDPGFRSVRFNELLGAAEIEEAGVMRRWTDTDAARAAKILESDYGIYSPQKLQSALRLFFDLRRTHPIRERVEALAWDGEARIGQFLSRWMRCEDTPYTREVSRLIFAGGIHRLYDPGCKFDTVPVLTGRQGSGKSTVVRWLAMQDEWFAELTELEGRESIEQLSGAWICEIAELLAFTRVKEQEAVKSFLSRQRDRYRRPYDREITELPRQCVFLGTTNRQQFLRDRTGNRRFCPVEVHSTGAELYAHESECRAYIAQCWAEAKALYDRGELPAVPDRVLYAQFEAAQEDAMEGDWRVGALENYVWMLPEGHLLCVREAARIGLALGDDKPRDPTRAESIEIAQILDRIPELERVGRRRVTTYGSQMVWKKTNDEQDEQDSIKNMRG